MACDLRSQAPSPIALLGPSFLLVKKPRSEQSWAMLLGTCVSFASGKKNLLLTSTVCAGDGARPRALSWVRR